MGIILEVLGILGIIGGIGLSLSGAGLAVGLIVILEGIVLFTIGSIYRIVRAMRQELRQLALRVGARTSRARTRK